MITVLNRTQPESTASEDGVMVSEIPAIEFVTPMPGFNDHSRFALVELDESGVLCSMQSLDDPDLRFLVAPPVALFPNYAPVVDDETVADLEIVDPADILLLVVLNAGATLADTTANLLAPVLVNLRTLKAKQVILDDPALELSAPLSAA